MLHNEIHVETWIPESIVITNRKAKFDKNSIGEPRLTAMLAGQFLDSLVFHEGGTEKLGEFPGAPAGIDRCGKSLFSRRVSLTGSQAARALHLRLCARRRRGVAHPFLSALAHRNVVGGFCMDVFTDYSTLPPCPFLPLVSLSLSRPFLSVAVSPFLFPPHATLAHPCSPSSSVGLLDFAQPKNT